jgi:hypothetical protein
MQNVEVFFSDSRRHAPPEHLLRMVTCVEEFDAIVKDYNSGKNLVRKAKRRIMVPCL